MDKLFKLLYKIRYEFPVEVISTYSNCVNMCGNSARGGGVCVHCLKSDLSTLVGNDLANRFVDSIEDQHQCINEMKKVIDNETR